MVGNGICLSNGEYRHIVPFLCLVVDVFYFLQELLNKGRSYPTRNNVYLPPISACHVEIDRNTIGQHQLIWRCATIEQGFKATDSAVESVVLNALSQSPFEPIESIDL